MQLALLVVALIAAGLLVAVLVLLRREATREERERGRAEQAAAELEKLIESRTHELSRLSTHLQELSETEKFELARRLHDELGGLLTAAKMDLSWLQSRPDTTAVQERLTQLGGVLDEAMDLKRRVVEELRPSLLDHFGLPTALRAYIDSTCAKAGLQANITAEDGEPIPRNVAIALFRIAQEGLANTVRHAQARNVWVEVSDGGAEYLFTLRDDGQGFDANGTGHGIMGMRQRVRALGGRFELRSSPGGGTRLQVAVPKELETQ